MKTILRQAGGKLINQSIGEVEIPNWWNCTAEVLILAWQIDNASSNQMNLLARQSCKNSK